MMMLMKYITNSIFMLLLIVNYNVILISLNFDIFFFAKINYYYYNLTGFQQILNIIFY